MPHSAPILRSLRHARWAALALLAALLPGGEPTVFSAVHGFEPRFVMPPNSILKSIRDYGAVGDGVADDTAAFQAAMTAGQRRLYIPAGIYLVRDTIRPIGNMKRILWIGESQRTSIIRLAPSAPGFQDPANPKPVLHTRSPTMHAEQNFHCMVWHLGIEVGPGNPGAIGLVMHTNNSGGVRDISVRNLDPLVRAARGIAFDDYWFGPGSASSISVDGFATGIFIGSAINHVTIDHALVRSCTVAIDVGGNALSLRKLRSEGCAQALRMTANGMTAMLDCQLLGGSGGAAIDLGGGRLLAHRIATSGFATAAGPGTGTGLTHHVSEAVASAWPVPAAQRRLLDLAVQDPPEAQYPQTAADWAVIPPGPGVRAAMQQAIDAGARTIYHQGGDLDGPVILRNQVERVMGLGEGTLGLAAGQSAAFRLATGAAPAVRLEICHIAGASAIEHDAPRTLVLRQGGTGYRTLPGAAGGRVFIDSVVGYPFHFTGVSAWVRDLNTEQGGDQVPNVVNSGSDLWILGHKTEDYAIKIRTVSGGRTELLGGTYRQNWDAADGVDALLDGNPLFEVGDGATGIFSYRSWSNHAGAPPYKYPLAHTRGAETRRIASSASGSVHALMVAWPGPVIGDADGDGDCDGADVALIAAHYGQRSTDPGYDARADLTGDGAVTIEDLGLATGHLAGP